MMRGFRGLRDWRIRDWGLRGWIVGLPLAVLLHAPAWAESPQCRMECDAAGAASNPAVVRLCLTRCEVRRSALGNRGPEGTTAMATPRTAWTMGPAPAGRAATPAPAPTQVAARGTPGRTAGGRGPAGPALPPTLSTAVAQAAQPPGQGFMASVMGAQAATLPPGVTPARAAAPQSGRRTN